MKQAIDEEFILDVLHNYTTYTSYYKIIKNRFQTIVIMTSRVPKENLSVTSKITSTLLPEKLKS